ncbi:MAG: NAD(P)-dependent oxidoreductase [Nitrososphaerales archaeon]
MSENKKTKVGVVGLGKMGSALAGNLLSRGYDLHLYNRSADKARDLKSKGAIFHSTPLELGKAVDIAITSLTDDKAVEQVVMGQNGLLRGLKKGSLWIDASTIDPDASVKHANECLELGVERLDVPVTGSPDRALQGKLILFVGGSQGVFSKHEGFLSELGTPLYLGADGNGHKMKLLINLYLGTISLAFAEGMVFAQKLGFEPQVFVETLNKTSHKSSFTENKGPKVARGEFSPTFTLNNMLKDIRLADSQARKIGAVLPAASLVTQLFATASNVGEGDKDFSAIALEIQRANGLE